MIGALVRRAGGLGGVGVICALVVLLGSAGPASAAVSSGTVTVRTGGLPAGDAPSAVLSGPGLRRRVRSRSVTLSHARAGRYTLTLLAVRLRRGTGPVKAGAVASGRAVSAVLRPGLRVTLEGAYGTIVNPGLRALSVRVIAVGGSAAHPNSVRLAGRPALAAGDVLSLPASPALPGGVFARVRSVTRRASSTTVTLAPVSVFSVVPVATFDVPLNLGRPSAAGDRRARLAAVAQCGSGPSIVGGVGVYRTVRNARFSGGWNTISIFGAHIPIGLSLATDFDIEAGVTDSLGVSLGASCEVDIPFQAVVAGVPVTGAVYGDVHGSVGGGVGFDAQLGLHVHAAVNTVGTPPALVFAPQVTFSHPTEHVNAAAAVAVSAGFGAGVKVGLGSIGAHADTTLNFNNDYDFTAQASAPAGSGCTTQVKFASFNAEAQLGPWTVQSPSTPPLFTLTLWRPTRCEPSGSGTQVHVCHVPVGEALRTRGFACSDAYVQAERAERVWERLNFVTVTTGFTTGGLHWRQHDTRLPGCCEAEKREFIGTRGNQLIIYDLFLSQ